MLNYDFRLKTDRFLVLTTMPSDEAYKIRLRTCIIRLKSGQHLQIFLNTIYARQTGTDTSTKRESAFSAQYIQCKRNAVTTQ